MRVRDLTVQGRCLVMGIVNVTEDSFSDGGKWIEVDNAITHARELVAQGADMIDVGGESTRPGATRVDPELEARRVAPVIAALSQEGIATSVDTMRASTALAAAEAGVSMINDVSGGLADPQMYRAMAETDLPVCLMHWRTVAGAAFAEASGAADHGDGVVADVHRVLDELVDKALAAGTREDNWSLLQALPEFIAGEFPVLVGASRKRFLAEVRSARGLKPSPVDADPATAAVTAISAHQGAWGVRVHDVPSSRDAVDVAAAWNTGGKDRHG